MAAIYCDAGCGLIYAIEVGMEGDPVHQFFCPDHFCAFALALMKAWEEAQAAAQEPSDPGSEAEFREVSRSRRGRRPARPRVMAVDEQPGAVVEDPPAPVEAGG
ncbi:MAG TPA: hypothetical protein VHQ90_00165 [Thermoanaerobaculia bacterium]|nr:hypothetical protein [Thermoanaerobaculia bacterium]